MSAPSVPDLLCPHCHEALHFTPASSADPGTAPASLRCSKGHHFDAARQGYFNFLVGKGTVFEADSAPMVAARYDFLASGHYDPLADAVADAVAPALTAGSPLILDAGTGTGHYLRRVLDRFAPAAGLRALAMDISKFAVRRAARLNPEAINVVSDIWQPLPVADGTVDAIMVVFAPRNVAGFARALRPGGLLVVVTPRPGHLAEIAAATGMLGIEPGKEERLATQMGTHFRTSQVQDLDVAMELGTAQVADLAFMGPAGHHLDRAALAEKLAARTGSAGTTPVTAQFRITTFVPLPA
ncbi:methyltransferase domain-containing protein [Pseudarthrobacter sp. J75]|uniref:methyltransferase domain-containing protein n=1 Tax=unclassified Pseudarthrobacter TaxID=2647000 RepID=UPI002E802696|nr:MULTISPECIES: methyltransferase domain-containing protein [unclassified Pseudarthrobacter]MEE2523127.1 methyltransferase domain-containing protein [Pseudarthrobacter sp. J47]MEE2529810.1 methyltransferase domain-containing protein [Pseudarthrobacter sp. J75]